jgi:hypothetical protein
VEEKLATIKIMFFGALDYVLKNTGVHFRAVAGSATRSQRRSGKFVADLLDAAAVLAQRVDHSRHQFVKLEPGRLRMSLLAENTMNEVYTMKEVIDRMCCLTQELAQIELLGRFSDLRYGNTNVVEQAR